tara:strand:- start:2698 stop:3588 length:891 start_codon:yes stop_codon:yes gene_type:complete
MNSNFKIKPLQIEDISNITNWLRIEGFAPGSGDLNIYRNTDNQGIWVGWLNDKPIGCIAGIRYNSSYGFIGLFFVLEGYRGNGFGVELWKHALLYLKDIPCIGLEAAPNRINDYSNWGFQISSTTTRWQWKSEGGFIVDNLYIDSDLQGIKVIEAVSLPSSLVQTYDANREPSPRPHFLTDWLNHPEGKVLGLVDEKGNCHGFGRIRPCLLKNDVGWRIGPLLADTPPLAEFLLRELVSSHSGVVLLDSPGLNPYSKYLLERLGFSSISQTYRMYKGSQPPVSMNQVYGLACLELG